MGAGGGVATEVGGVVAEGQGQPPPRDGAGRVEDLGPRQDTDVGVGRPVGRSGVVGGRADVDEVERSSAGTGDARDRRVGTPGDLGAVLGAVVVAVGDQRRGGGRLLAAVRYAVVVGVGRPGVGSGGDLGPVGAAVPVRV